MKKRALCFGTFDGLHPGHEDYFRQAKALAEELAVVVARDATVLEVKGNLPATNELDRLRAVQEHPLVDRAMLGYPDDRYRVIEDVQPDLICLGYDQNSFTGQLEDELVRRGVEATILRCEPFYPETYKSSLLRREVAVVEQGENAESLKDDEETVDGLPI